MNSFREAILRWHRLLGLGAALFLTVFAATGLLLEHGRLLGLERTHLDHSVLMQHYGLVPQAAFESRRTAAVRLFGSAAAFAANWKIDNSGSSNPSKRRVCTARTLSSERPARRRACE